MNAFVLLMVRNPEVLKKAQADSDRVIGHDRLPDFGDMESLTYLSCVFKEILRYVTRRPRHRTVADSTDGSWVAPVPLAIPHSSMKDDVYRGYNIAAGTMLLPNIW